MARRLVLGLGGLAVFIVVFALGRGEALTAQHSFLESAPRASHAEAMPEFGAIVHRLQAWAAAGWQQPGAAPALGGTPLPCPDRLEPMLAHLKQHLAGLEAPAEGGVPHFSERRSDAVLAVRMLALALGSEHPKRADRALIRLERACSHCHAACRP